VQHDHGQVLRCDKRHAGEIASSLLPKKLLGFLRLMFFYFCFAAAYGQRNSGRVGPNEFALNNKRKFKKIISKYKFQKTY
jgi:hypothetical protein